MILYHGSTVVVIKPDISKSRPKSDFGIGFYATSSFEQAKRWAIRNANRENKDLAYVSSYSFDYEIASNVLSVKVFENADEEWLSFVVDNRNGNPCCNKYDIVIGPVADDKVYQTISFYENGIFDIAETLKRLKTEVLQDQWVYCSDRAIDYLEFQEAFEVRREE